MGEPLASRRYLDLLEAESTRLNALAQELETLSMLVRSHDPEVTFRATDLDGLANLLGRFQKTSRSVARRLDTEWRKYAQEPDLLFKFE